MKFTKRENKSKKIVTHQTFQKDISVHQNMSKRYRHPYENPPASLPTYFMCTYLSVKVLCYIQSEKMWVIVLQNQHMFTKTSPWNGLQTEQIISANIWYTYFFNFGHCFCDFFSKLFSKAPTYCGKKNWNNFCYIGLLFVWAQKVCFRFLKSYFKLETLISLLFAVPFSVDMFNLKVNSIKKLIFLQRKHQR